MNHPSYPLSSEDYQELIKPIAREILLIRKDYNKLSEKQLHELAATLTSDVVYYTFGWVTKPTIEGKEIEPIRLRGYV